MNIKYNEKQAGVCKSIVSGMMNKKVIPDSGICKQAVDVMKKVKSRPQEAAKEALPSVQTSSKSFLQVFPVLIISELNSPFSLV